MEKAPASKFSVHKHRRQSALPRTVACDGAGGAGRVRSRQGGYKLDGMIAHLYGLTEEEFAYILTTFPLVAQEVKNAALAEYRARAPVPLPS